MDVNSLNDQSIVLQETKVEESRKKDHVNSGTIQNVNITVKLIIASVLEIIGASVAAFFVPGFGIYVADVQVYGGGNGFEGWLLGFAFIIFILGMIGGIFAITRKNFFMALVGGIFTSFTLIGIPALILVIMSRNEFKKFPNATVEGKNRTVSVLLAVFLTNFTWLYTYKKDAWKFWVGLIVQVIVVPLAFIYPEASWWIAIETSIWIGIWVWALLDVLLKKEAWYKNY